MKIWPKHNRGFLVFLLCFAFLRTALADWNPIPSGSMRPTLLEGDVVLVNRLAYDFKLPLSDIMLLKLGDLRRGDAVTFTSPTDAVRLIKRLLAVPGDVVEMRDRILFINGSAAQYSNPEVLAQPLEYPRRLLIGRAHPILVSANIKGDWLPRLERIGERIQ